MGRKTDASSQRVRIARVLDESAMRTLASAIRPGADARIELVLNGARERIARGTDATDLRALFAAADGSCGEMELVLAGNQRK